MGYLSTILLRRWRGIEFRDLFQWPTGELSFQWHHVKIAVVISKIVTHLFSTFRNRFPALSGPKAQVRHACDFCGSTDAELLAKADYWDLQQVELVRCLKCRNSRLDPRLTAENVEAGCIALYRLQHSQESTTSRRKGFSRAFRKGVAFGAELKLKGFTPARVLEIGAGDGFFLKGVQFVFPQAKCACLDVVKEILLATEAAHGFSSYHSSVELFQVSPHEKFDLIIARDILEHVNEPGKALRQLSDALNENGILYILTPNGLQDGWQLFSRWEKDRVPGELLINHVNYFDPRGLREFLATLNLEIREFFVYDFKQFFRGAGWRLIEKHMSRVSTRRSASTMIQTTPELQVTFQSALNTDVFPAVFKMGPLKPLWMLYCWLKHSPKLRVGPEALVGEEISVLAIRK